MKLLHPLTRPLRKAYDWMLAFADKPHAEKALFGLSFIESSFFPIPPDPLLLAMGAARPERAIRYAVITTVASVLGALLGYLIGAVLMDTVGVWLLDLYDPNRALWQRVESWYLEYGALALLVAAITPIPYKVFTIASGAIGMALLPFVFFSLIGRGFRFGIEGVLLRFYGAPITAWINKWFDIVAVGFTVLLIGGFVLLAYL
jgi:membrane protein YqaA with SNARE-associated domain